MLFSIYYNNKKEGSQLDCASIPSVMRRRLFIYKSVFWSHFVCSESCSTNHGENC